MKVALNIAGAEKHTLGNVAVAINTYVILFEFGMKGALVTVEIFVLCG